MTDHERALAILVHDLRTPLGVASGYLRLVRDGRVPPSTEPVVLLDRALEALRSISRLCMDADRWLAESPNSRPATTSAVQLLTALSSQLATRSITLQGVDDVPAGQLLVCGDAGELADAVAEVLSAAARPNGVTPMKVECASQPDELVLTVRDANERDATWTAFDPWRGPGLQTVIACRTIVRAGGSWTASGPDRLRAALPWAPPGNGAAAQEPGGTIAAG
jgi:signal transduction histidine kinase